MKKILLSIIISTVLVLSSFGQAPEGFKYQAVLRDASNTIITNQAVGIKLTIQQGSVGGTAVYTETFSPTTNAYGLVNLEIGTGITTDDFTTIDWSNGDYFIETAIDVTGGSNYSVMGTSQLMSVPYALYAKTSGNGSGPIGPQGIDGLSAYSLAYSADSTIGTEIEWLASLKGDTGATGPAGPAGADGIDGADGATGPAGSDATNFWTESGSNVYRSSGNVGIGTTTPSENLVVNGNIETLFAAGKIGFDVGDSYNSGNFAHYGLSKVGGNNLVNLAGYYGLSFGTFGSEKMRLTSNGRLGIGTSSPARDFSLSKPNPGGQVRLEVENTSNNANSHSIMSIYNGGAAAGDPFLFLNVPSGNSYSMGIDNSDGDKFKISSGWLLGSGDLLTVTNSGNVGIGTTSPRATLNVTNDISNNSEGNTIPNAYGGNATTTLVLGHGVTGSIPNYWGLNLGTLYNGRSYLQGSHTNGSSFYDILLNPNGGNVGIGTTNPSSKLEVNGNTRINGNLLMGGYAQDGTPSKIHIGSYNSDIPTGSDPALLYVGGDHDLNGTLLKIADYNNDGSTSKVVHFKSENNQDDYFFTPDVNGGKHYYRGKVGIGTSAVFTHAKLHISNGSAAFDGWDQGIKWVSGNSMLAHMFRWTSNNALYVTNNGNSNLIGVYLPNGGTSWISTSDGRLKENINEISYGLKDVLKLSVKEYNYKSTENKNKTIGFIAQEVYKVIPELVEKGDDLEYSGQYDTNSMKESDFKPWGVNYSSFGVLAIKAIQEQQIQIDALQKELELIKTHIGIIKLPKNNPETKTDD